MEVVLPQGKEGQLSRHLAPFASLVGQGVTLKPCSRGPGTNSDDACPTGTVLQGWVLKQWYRGLDYPGPSQLCLGPMCRWDSSLGRPHTRPV